MKMNSQLHATTALPAEKAPLRRNGEVELQLHAFLSTTLNEDE
jgi:hypothetical protein